MYFSTFVFFEALDGIHILMIFFTLWLFLRASESLSFNIVFAFMLTENMKNGLSPQVINALDNAKAVDTVLLLLSALLVTL